MPSDLDFISRPNPVEPSALNTSASSHHLPFLLDSRHQQRRDAPFEIKRSARQSDQTSGLPIASVLNNDDDTQITPPRQDQALYTLPKLPVKRNNTKRHRVPPVLQGLHEPPPTSRILPSISAEDTLLPAPRNPRTLLNEESSPVNVTEDVSLKPTSGSSAVSGETKSCGKRAVNRNKWTDQETEDLLSGVAKFGIGSWKKILMCPDLTFNRRTAVDLKDRFRVCKPNAYGKPRTKKAKQALKEKVAKSASIVALPEPPPGSLCNVEETNTHDNAISIESADIDNDQVMSDTALWKVKRRQRRKFTAEEDEALLLGYEEHGLSWQAIQREAIFQEAGRTPTDLRDRFRTKFPEQYAQAGLAPRPAVFPKPLPRSGGSGEDKKEAMESCDVPAVTLQGPKKTSTTITSFNIPSQSTFGHQLHGLPLPRLPDDFLPYFGGFNDEDDDAGPIVLDRSIVDWANNNMPSSRQGPRADSTMHPGIDPLITLKLPNPGAAV